ncbi:hypothetical protein INR49_001953 [Caranx melampygus]|nr:hypothetical protein INR49_001953 [Caranx melampygus]
MAVLRSPSSLLWLLVVTAHVTEAAWRSWQRMTLTDDGDRVCGSQDNTVSLKSRKRSGPVVSAGPEPGDVAAAFRVPTLDGEFSYQPGAVQGSVIIHAFTNKSGFLECLWSSESSLSSLLQELPDSTHVLFLSLDDSAVNDALWMREQLQRAAMHSKKEVLSRLHFSPVPVFALGNWIPNVLYYWSCKGKNCGLSQAAFTSEGKKRLLSDLVGRGWNMPVIIKRLDARYDWLMAGWGQRSYQLVDAGNGCDPSPSVAGGVAWVSEGSCSFFTKVQSMAKSNASGVLVYALPGNPIQDMNCVEDECYSRLGIPAAMVHLEPSVAQALRFGQKVNVSFQMTPSPNFFISIDPQGALAEMGWFLYPSFRFINWQAQWFDFYADLQIKLKSPASVVPVFDKVQMQGEKGAVATVDLPLGILDFDMLELDASLSCPSRRDLSCAPWDHTVQLFVCCNRLSPYCNMELGRWITAFRRGIGHWFTDVTPLIPLLDGNKCTFTMKTVPWAMPWIVSLNLRFTLSNKTGNLVEQPRPFRVMSLYSGGTFNKTYNKRYQPIKFPVPASTKKVELVAVITGHGSDENGCGEFCVTSHHFLVNALDLSGSESNTIVYFGLFDGQDPNPSQPPGYIIMSSFLVFYK